MLAKLLCGLVTTALTRKAHGIVAAQSFASEVGDGPSHPPAGYTVR